ncbi:hypothetical protein ACW6ND_08680, partial [Bifidobacterium adolescentis]
MSEDKKNGKQNKTVKPFDPMTLRGVTVRNRIWLPPMDTYSALAQDGKVVPEKLRTLDHGRPWSDDQFASTRLSSNRD